VHDGSHLNPATASFVSSANEFPVQSAQLAESVQPDIDVTAAEQLRTYIQGLRDRGIRFVIAKAHLPFRETARSLGATEAFAESNYFPKVSEAVAEFERQSPTRN
jgi:hypothetical protein